MTGTGSSVAPAVPYGSKSNDSTPPRPRRSAKSGPPPQRHQDRPAGPGARGRSQTRSPAGPDGTSAACEASGRGTLAGIALVQGDRRRAAFAARVSPPCRAEGPMPSTPSSTSHRDRPSRAPSASDLGRDMDPSPRLVLAVQNEPKADCRGRSEEVPARVEQAFGRCDPQGTVDADLVQPGHQPMTHRSAERADSVGRAATSSTAT